MKLLKQHWLFFTALAVTYLPFSPGTISDMGYMAENIEACNEIISNLGEWATLQYASTRVSWPRHGLYELILEIPFILVGKLFLGAAPEKSALALSLQPVIFSALLCTLLFEWVRRITGSLSWAFVLGLAAAFSTMIWPYAYIGLETTQSLFFLLTAFIAIELRENRSWKTAIILSVCAAMSISLKSNGVFLGPAVAYLGYVYFRPELESGLRESRRLLLRPAVSASIVLSLYLLNSYIRSLSPIWHPGTYRMFLHSV
ncbi:MAG TPA: glycosyltransferase family 39 protein, partial [Blastocatellia bacterium]|nr:glycosyltransferase family 39 protein [Blastocatellia bacterium]